MLLGSFAAATKFAPSEVVNAISPVDVILALFKSIPLAIIWISLPETFPPSWLLIEIILYVLSLN